MLKRHSVRLMAGVTVLLTALLSAPDAAGHYCWIYSAGAADPSVQIPWTTTNPGPGCTSTNALHSAGDQTNQLIGDTHRNWHCTFPVADTDAYGRAFIAFHRQLILDFDIERIAGSVPTIETFDPFPNVPVPGNFENTSSGYTHCQSSAGSRPAGALCAGCSSLPSDFVGSSLADFESIGHLGRALEGGGGPSMPQPFGWHGSYHGGVGSLGCDDVGGFIYTSYDPAFWMAHKKLDEIVWDWQNLQAADVVIVLDRSGSMDDNCDAIPPTPGTDCAIEDAKDAARLFADLVVDVRMNGGVPTAEQHRIGLVSYNGVSPASIDLPLSPANGILPAFNTAITPITAGGGTSIGAGVREAINMLNGLGAGANKAQAILVLTDGKENTPPCIEGATSPCLSGDIITNAELGTIQVVSIGFGAGANEYHVRRLAERHGGVFLAQSDLSATLDLAKFYVTAFGTIFDVVVSADPRGMFLPGQVKSDPFEIGVSGADDRLSVVLGFDETTRARECPLRLELFTPTGQRVDLTNPAVETGAGDDYHFVHVNLPYAGQTTGTWKGRIVRPAAATRLHVFPGDRLDEAVRTLRERGAPILLEQDGKDIAAVISMEDLRGCFPDITHVPTGRECGRQDYFYSTLVRGLGRVRPVGQPDTTVGRRIVASFRMSESNRPVGDWDQVKATVTVTRPEGSTSTHVLHDDGTHGDRLANNNYWTVELPEPTKREGVHHLRGRFELTKDGSTRVREAEYSVTVQPAPDQCANPLCSTFIRVRPGEVESLQAFTCVVNSCASDDQFEVSIRDSEGWLKTRDSYGALIDWPGKPFRIGTAEPGHEVCFGNDQVPLFSVVPKTARVRDSTEITTVIRSLTKRGQEDISCVTNVLVVPPPDCNGNGIADSEDIARGTSKDGNGDGFPDECGEDHGHSLPIDPRHGDEPAPVRGGQ